MPTPLTSVKPQSSAETIFLVASLEALPRGRVSASLAGLVALAVGDKCHCLLCQTS